MQATGQVGWLAWPCCSGRLAAILAKSTTSKQKFPHCREFGGNLRSKRKCWRISSGSLDRLHLTPINLAGFHAKPPLVSLQITSNTIIAHKWMERFWLARGRHLWACSPGLSCEPNSRALSCSCPAFLPKAPSGESESQREREREREEVRVVSSSWSRRLMSFLVAIARCKTLSASSSLE